MAILLVLPLLALSARNIPDWNSLKKPGDGNDPGWQSFDPGWPAGPFARTPLKYKIQIPLSSDGKTPAAPLAAVDVWHGGYDTSRLQPFVMAADGSRRAVKIIWQRPDEPVRLLFETGPAVNLNDNPNQAHGSYYLYFGEPKKNLSTKEWTSRYSFTLETKNFDEKTLKAFDQNSLESFVTLWNQTPDPAGRSLTPHVQHGYHPHRGYIETPLEYQAAMGAPLALARYTGYFKVEAADETRIKPFEQEIQSLREEIERLTLELETKNSLVDEAAKALAASEKSGDENAVRNNKTALNERQQRRDLLQKKVLPSKQRRLEYLTAAISEIKNNTHTFLAGSKGASWALVDGVMVTAWPASEKLPARGDKYYGFKEGPVNLEPGIHRIEFLYAAVGKEYVAFLLWRRPAQEQAVIMEPEGFTDISEAGVVNAFIEGGARPIAWKTNADSRIPGVPDMIWTTFFLPGEDDSGEKKESPYQWSFGDGGAARGSRVEYLYLQPGRYKVTVSEFRENDDTTPLWQVSQTIHIHAPFDLKNYIKTEDMRRMILGKNLAACPTEHVLTALRAVEALDPDRLAYNDWRRHVARTLGKRPKELATISPEWTVRAADICMNPAVSLYPEALDLYNAAVNALPENSPALRLAMIRHARANVLAAGNGEKAVEILLAVKPGGKQQIAEARPVSGKTHNKEENFEWNTAWGEALLAVDKSAEAESFIKAWRDTLGEQTPEQSIQQTALFRRIRSLIQNGSESDLLSAMDMLNEMVRTSPERLISPEFHIMMIDMRLGCKAYTAAYHQSTQALNLDLNPTHRAEIMSRKVIALCGLRKLDEAREALEKLEADYPYSSALRKARNKLAITQEK